MRQNPQYIDIEIDKLTNSIENVITGDSFQTDVSMIAQSDLKSITKKMDGYLTGETSINSLTETFTN